MTEADAQDIVRDRYRVSRETMKKLAVFRDMLLVENKVQNLIAASTETEFWSRHILDSAQIIGLAPAGAKSWLDVGTGAGLPGVVLSLLTHAHHHLVEPRKLRAGFVQAAVDALGVSQRVDVIQQKVERVRLGQIRVVTARAFASLTKTLAATHHLADENMVWVLNKGRQAAAEVDEARRHWDGEFTLHPSVTDPDASLVRAANVRRKAST